MGIPRSKLASAYSECEEDSPAAALLMLRNGHPDAGFGDRGMRMDFSSRMLHEYPSDLFSRRAIPCTTASLPLRCPESRHNMGQPSVHDHTNPANGFCGPRARQPTDETEAMLGHPQQQSAWQDLLEQYYLHHAAECHEASAAPMLAGRTASALPWGCLPPELPWQLVPDYIASLLSNEVVNAGSHSAEFYTDLLFRLLPELHQVVPPMQGSRADDPDAFLHHVLSHIMPYPRN
jgi:hypothetical protein